jgi:mono/diheme cytochrome c family protein
MGAARRSDQRGARWALLVAVGLLLAGGLGAPGQAQELTNPYPATGDSLARGRDVYTEHCAICHGVSGRGDGPLARTMSPRPADFRIHLAEGHGDAQLFDWVSNGVPETQMAGFAEVLGADDRWHVINFILTFLPTDR